MSAWYYRVPCAPRMTWAFSQTRRVLECVDCGDVYAAEIGPGEVFWKWVADCHAARHGEWTQETKSFITCRYLHGLLMHGLTHWAWRTQDGHDPFEPRMGA